MFTIRRYVMVLSRLFCFTAHISRVLPIMRYKDDNWIANNVDQSFSGALYFNFTRIIDNYIWRSCSQTCVVHCSNKLNQTSTIIIHYSHKQINTASWSRSDQWCKANGATRLCLNWSPNNLPKENVLMFFILNVFHVQLKEKLDCQSN